MPARYCAAVAAAPPSPPSASDRNGGGPCIRTGPSNATVTLISHPIPQVSSAEDADTPVTSVGEIRITETPSSSAVVKTCVAAPRLNAATLSTRNRRWVGPLEVEPTPSRVPFL